ncbi:YbjQ family protein [Pedobacter flavus]|uniref:Heavy metal-binding domain-containing protein n=1 Tax=Pedobacter flavus TaxID=3113906 RepID=A0ABU7H2Q4_9SPHI|nr:heavy metal-binding domain-containing protein [Pedobacter sp. VNH31]MEE1885498.1 heavy metal-binding domain-containing protein [Pedobacter sp. VNH31]
MIITTSNHLPDNKILAYFDPINANAVVGMDLVADFASSITDIFGGRSSNYENRLDLLFEEAKNSLIEKCKRLKCNGLIGFSVDFNEISAKGKGMLMVSVYGTPVIFESKQEIDLQHKILDYKSLNYKIKAKEILNKYDSEIIPVIGNSDFEFIVQSKNLAFESIIIKLLNNPRQILNFQGVEKELLPSQILNYYYHLDKNISIERLYKLLENTDNLVLVKQILIFIDDVNLASLSKNLEGLKSDQFKLSKKVNFYELTFLDQHIYLPEDVNTMSEIIENLKNSLESIQPTIIEENKLLGKIQKWVCIQCETKNIIEDTFCSSCGRNKFGFVLYKKSVNKLLEELELKLLVLKETFF